MRDLIRSIAEWLLIKFLTDEEVIVLALLFATRIINGKSTFDEVPAKLKEKVAEILIDSGLPELVPPEFGGATEAEPETETETEAKAEAEV
jgi:hypothetical protein